MASAAGHFREVQQIARRRTAILVAVPPCGMLAVLVWQVVLGHPWGQHPISNGSIVGWTIFLWIIYLRLITVRMVTHVSTDQLVVSMRGLWRARRVPLSNICSVESIACDPDRDYGGYGIRSIPNGWAYVAKGNLAVRLKLQNGSVLVLGSQRPAELSSVLRTALEQFRIANGVTPNQDCK